MRIDQIKTMEDWWFYLDSNWGKLEILFQDMNIPTHTQISVYLNREARLSQGRTTYMKNAFAEFDTDMAWNVAMITLRQQRNPLIWGVLQGIWEDAPDHPKIHSWYWWGSFCDLLSTGMGLLDEPEHEEEEVNNAQDADDSHS